LPSFALANFTAIVSPEVKETLWVVSVQVFDPAAMVQVIVVATPPFITVMTFGPEPPGLFPLAVAVNVPYDDVVGTVVSQPDDVELRVQFEVSEP
jgi:hypothetical protein